MKAQSKESLIGPLVAGGTFGLLARLAAFGFTLEYGPHTNPEWHPLWLFALGQAAVTFAVVLGVTVLLFGLLPTWARRACSR